MKLRILTIAALALAVAAGDAWAADEAGEDAQVREIEIRSVHCEEGADCVDWPHHVIKIGEDGVPHTLDGEAWTGADGYTKALGLLHAGEARGFLGVQLTDMTTELRVHFGVPEDAGVLVAKVVEDSAAERAGIEVGDIIALVDGESVTSARSLSSAIAGHEEGEAVTLEIWRDGQVRRLDATLDERPAGQLMPKIRRLHGGQGGMHHGGHRSGEPRVEKRIEIRCDDGDEDCGAGLGDLDLDIDCETEDCEVEVRCEEDGCDCSVNGDEVDCAEIGVPEG